MKDLLRAKEVIRDDDREQVNVLQPKICPHCRQSNRPDAQFCFRCNFVMSFEAYTRGVEEQERKNRELSELKNQMNKMGDLMERLIHDVNFYKDGFVSYIKAFGGRPLSGKERKKLEELEQEISQNA